MVEHASNLVNIAKSLPSSQAEVLAFYKRFFSEHGRAPSIREAAKKLKREISNVHYHLKKLERMGLIVRTPGYRGVRLVEQQEKLIPLLGVVACGEPITIFEESEEAVSVPDSMITNGYGHYALRAKGNSMINAKIGDGDILVIRKQSNVEDGKIAVVAIGEPPFESATLKTVFHTKSSLLLVPQNDALDPYVVKNGEVRGKLVGVIRNFDSH
ncbi:MAG: transcriptional repressor LexA [Candidatus Peribacteraceae bacterium]|jgi:repressor LexA